MKRFIITVVVVMLVGVVAVGFYRGWFALSSRSPDAGSNKVNVSLSLDPDKVNADAVAVRGKAAELAGQAKEEPAKPVKQATDSK
jgi:hypothetical protein